MMKTAIISDLHILDEEDPNFKILEKFFKHSEVQSSDRIILLGDIFDLFCGLYPQLSKHFPRFFDYLGKLLDSGKTVYIFEGNHDMLLADIFKNAFPKYFSKQLRIFKEPFIEKSGPQKILFTHGDELVFWDTFYQNYRAFMRTKFLYNFGKFFFPYKAFRYFGDIALAKSLKRREHYKPYETSEEDRVKVREGAKKVLELGSESIDIIVAGHTHIEDDVVINRGDSKTHYINNGFPPRSQKFILLQSGQASLRAL